jgi:hypothetical protein
VSRRCSWQTPQRSLRSHPAWPAAYLSLRAARQVRRGSRLTCDYVPEESSPFLYAGLGEMKPFEGMESSDQNAITLQRTPT